MSPSHVNIPASCYQVSTLVRPLDRDVRSHSPVGLWTQDPSVGSLEQTPVSVAPNLLSSLSSMTVDARIRSSCCLSARGSVHVALQLEQQQYRGHLCLPGASVVFAADTSRMDNETLPAEPIVLSAGSVLPGIQSFVSWTQA